MPACAAVNCYNRHYKGCGKTFHVFPLTRPWLAEQWLENMRRARWFPARKSSLCSDHFEERCFDRTGATVRLRENAVPTIFDFTRHSTKDLKSRKRGKRPKPRNALNKPGSSAEREEVASMGNIKKGSSEEEPGLKKHKLDHTGDANENVQKKLKLPPHTAQPAGFVLSVYEGIPAVNVDCQPDANSSSGSVSPMDINTTVECAGDSFAGVPLDHDYTVRLTANRAGRTKNPGDGHQAQKKAQVSLLKSLKPKVQVSSLAEIIKDLRQNHFLSEDSAAVLQTSFSGEPLEILSQLIQNEQTSKVGYSYPPVLRNFALTLMFCSSKAYQYVRNTFDVNLPPQSVLRGWYSSSNGEPGFTEEVFSALKTKASEANYANQNVICSLSIGEMSLQRSVEWDGTKARGFMDVGTGVEDDDSMPVAKRAIVFMVAAINDTWKVPCGYFLSHSLTGDETANLVKICLEKLYDIQVPVVSVTFDSPNSHFSTIKSLGGNLKVPLLIPWFPHPSDRTKKIYIIFDACQTLQLVRHCLAAAPYLVDGDNQQINWSFILDLHRWLEKDGSSRTEAKLHSVYINWAKHKMDVNLVAQTLCSSIADALEFCCHDLKLEQFRGCEGTVKFIRIVVRLFDVLNSINPLARNYKSPLSRRNEERWRPFLREAERYLLELKDHKGSSVYFTSRKTGYVAFLVNIMSTLALCESLVTSEDPLLKYLPTSKLSMDHMEWFLHAIHMKRNKNNMPTSREFVAAYKYLVTRRSNNGCQVQNDQLQVPLATPSAVAKFDENFANNVNSLDISEIRRHNTELLMPVETVEDFKGSPNIIVISQHVENSMSYVGGYVVCMVEKQLHCPECTTALHMEKLCQPRQEHLFVRKDTGTIVNPSPSVLTICNSAERCLKCVVNSLQDMSLQAERITVHVRISVLRDACDRGDLFDVLHNHMFDMSPETNHVIKLINLVAECYVRLRLHHLAQQQKYKRKLTNR